MAGIDKIYVNSVERWKEFKNWLEINQEKCKKETGYNIIDHTNINNYTIQEIDSWLEEKRKDYYDYVNNMKEIVNLPRTDEKFLETFGNFELNEDNEFIFTETYREDDINYWKKMVGENITLEDIEVDIPFSNFPMVCDRWVIQNCEIPWVIDRLKEQYGDEFNLIKNKKDVYSKPYEYIPSTRVKIIKNTIKRRKADFYKRDKKGWCVLPLESIEDTCNLNWEYISDQDKWINNEKELRPYTDGFIRYKYERGREKNYPKTYKALLRKIRKWKLPKGLILKITTCYMEEEIILMTK